MQLSAFADPTSATWDIEIDGRRLAPGASDAAASARVNFPAFELTGLASARLLAVWLADGTTLMLAARRPAGARGQDTDEIAVELLPSEPERQIFDPRLSTEYSASGVPRRFGIELWLGSGPDGEQRPLRVGGEAALGDAGLEDGPVRVLPMRARRGEGAGLALYILVQP